eukprot:TRINITY_DN40980_c0_g1_i1.p1 TRINITY_DN40980_c0_g1~~TRINITY_DN40980_c0_g1_i1.p1  ORF type:complete len:254 (+),score=65.14 TRINITY_DN40980_c0_g1_i1:76-762(+)
MSSPVRRGQHGRALPQPPDGAAPRRGSPRPVATCSSPQRVAPPDFSMLPASRAEADAEFPTKRSKSRKTSSSPDPVFQKLKALSGGARVHADAESLALLCDAVVKLRGRVDAERTAQRRLRTQAVKQPKQQHLRPPDRDRDDTSASSSPSGAAPDTFPLSGSSPLAGSGSLKHGLRRPPDQAEVVPPHLKGELGPVLLPPSVGDEAPPPRGVKGPLPPLSLRTARDRE